jgi:hypothetical protein
MLHLGEVNLYKLCQVFSGSAQADSHYKRLRRFVSQVVLPQRSLARFLVTVMGVEAGPWRLAMDRTNWKIGRTHVNILYLSLCHGSMAIPLFWSFLEDKKQGNSDHLDRIDLIELFIELFGKTAIGVLLMDREFIGKHWLEGFLQAQGIAYVVRLKESGYMANSRGRLVKMTALFHALKPGECVAPGRRKVGKGKDACSHFVAAMRLANGELLVVAHSRDVTDPLAEYRHRWGIEVMFKGFKSGGFELEATRITNPDRLETLTAVLAIAFCAAYRAGEQENRACPIPTKKHGYKQKSLFRTGLDLLRRTLATQKRTWRKIWRKIEKSYRYEMQNGEKI